MKKILFVTFLAALCSTTCMADDFSAVQSTISNNVYIEGKLYDADIYNGNVITLRLYDSGKTCYIGEIPVNADGSYSTKFQYGGDASQLSFDAKINGVCVNDSVLKAVSGSNEFVSAEVYIKDQTGGGVLLGVKPERTVYTAGKFSYTPEDNIEKDTEAGVVIYPKNKLGGDNTEYAVVLSQYDENSSLIGCSVLKSGTLSFDEYSGNTEIDCGNAVINDNTETLKAFIWQSAKSLVPYEPAADGVLESSTLYIIGASVYQNWGENSFPQAGIGSFVHDYFNEDYLTVLNKAVSGSRADSWLDDDPALGNWAAFIPLVKKGDYVYIALGGNDLMVSQSAEKVSLFRSSLTEMVRQIKAVGATPVLASPVLNSHPNQSGKVEISAYVQKAAEISADIAEKEGICYLPVAETAYEHLKDTDIDTARVNYYLDYNDVSTNWGLSEADLENHLNDSVKNGKNDEIHFNVRGADFYASIISETLKNSNSKLRFYLK